MMKKTLLKTLLIYGVIVLLAALLAACRETEQVPTAVPVITLPDSTMGTAVSPDPESMSAANTPIVSPTDTAVPPTPTPTEPLAARVNGQPVYLAAYEKELARYEQAAAQLGAPPEGGYQGVVLNALIEQALIEQAAAAQGITVSPEQVAQEIESLRAEGDFESWLAANLYTEEEFQEAVRQGLLAEQMIGLATAQVPQTAEQVHTRYIHVNDATQANELLLRAQGGDDFAFLADQFSLEPGNGGDMGWFARGALTIPELEEPAFALQNPGDLTAVLTITGSDGLPTYYILQLVERDAARPLTTEMRAQLLQAALAEWLAGLWENATIERLVDTRSS
ncbi:MAG TPA: SurA N-terminal domain-containing protein [Chloroflexota bacterium]|nr:SurA N-terminal domain-containing protein [Chloroflexota bacterium]